MTTIATIPRYDNRSRAVLIAERCRVLRCDESARAKESHLSKSSEASKLAAPYSGFPSREASQSLA